MYTIADYNIDGGFSCSSNFLEHSSKAKLPNILLLILLRGGFSIEKISEGKKVLQKKDYSILGIQSATEAELIDYIEKLQKNKSDRLSYNYKFYRSLLVEFCACMFALKQRQGIITFLHSYRILEQFNFEM